MKDKKFLSAKESDPVKMGWMQGFPPPESRLIQAEDGSFFTFPKLRYSVCHMRQFLTTVNVLRGQEPIVPLQYAIDDEINKVTFRPWDSDKTMTWEESLWENYTDGILILHKGKIVQERYFGCLTETGSHVAMSVTKSFTGIIAAMLVVEGLLKPDELVTQYLPELKNTAFDNATVRQVMDMTTTFQYSEDYADPNAEIWSYARAGNLLPKPQDYKGPSGFYDFLKTLKKENGHRHGEGFVYRTPNADLLGWIIASISGKSVATLLAEKIWSKLGMEMAAYYQVDGKGTPSVGTGFSASLRDMGRFGQVILNGGTRNGKRIIPEAVISEIRAGGSQKDFLMSNHPKLKGWSYKDMWWITHNDHGAFNARGIHGQVIYIDPMAEMVIVRFASHPIATNKANDAISQPAYYAIATYLMNK